MKTPRIKIVPAARFAGPLAALLLALASSPATSAEQALGRLFFTPERRQTLDRQRELNIQEKQPVIEDPTLTINGLVTRSSGRRTAWINGAPRNENETQGNVTVTPRHREPGRITVDMGDSPTANSRVGETVNRTTGESKDLLNDGRIIIKSQTAR